MAYRKRTLRSMSPVARKLARLIGELDSVSRRAKNLMDEIQLLEADSRALQFKRDQANGFINTDLFPPHPEMDS